MELRTLGQSDVRVSPVIFGAWAIGGWMWGGTEESDAIAAIHASLDNGVNTIDTAAVYGMGYSEELVAKALRGRRRDQIVIATKCGMRWDDPKNEGSDPWPQKDNEGRDVVIRKNSRPYSIAYECEQSLKRLQTDYIDLYQIHWPDVSTPVEESIRAMVKLQEQGKVRSIGVSNYPADWLAKAIKVAPIASDQPPYSLINRGIEKDVLPFCRENDVAVIVYSPLERGLLAGAVPPERQFPAGDHRATHKFFTVESRKKILAALKQLDPLREKHRASYAQLVINWTFNEPGITAALVGARNAEQAAHNAAAMNVMLTPEERAHVRRAFDDLARQVSS
jgi:aryl-alcohol dehydrogenase-like predicted oxidoreductase